MAFIYEEKKKEERGVCPTMIYCVIFLYTKSLFTGAVLANEWSYCVRQKYYNNPNHNPEAIQNPNHNPNPSPKQSNLC